MSYVDENYSNYITIFSEDKSFRRSYAFAFPKDQRKRFNSITNGTLSCLFAYDYPAMARQMDVLRAELLRVVMHPRNVARLQGLGLVL